MCMWFVLSQLDEGSNKSIVHALVGTYKYPSRSRSTSSILYYVERGALFDARYSHTSDKHWISYWINPTISLSDQLLV